MARKTILPSKGLFTDIDSYNKKTIKDKLGASGNLKKKWGIPPFSVIRASEGDWQKRKKQWLLLGIKSEESREDLKTYDVKINVDNYKGIKIMEATTSIFDPTLCEILYSWFCPDGGLILDPFAGGSVRGIVANTMGFGYYGIELRKEQVLANLKQKEDISSESQLPFDYICGDSKKVLRKAPMSDFLFSCPPYADLEVYSGLPDDISNKEYPTFLKLYTTIIERAVSKLKENRFACFVVANIRDKKTGFYNDLVGDTVTAFKKAGMGFYNDIVYVTPAGSLPIRASKTFKAGRKVGKSHQNILVFYKGDPKEIKNVMGEE